MKKTLVVIMAFGFLAGWSAAVLVDDFNGYSIGPAATVTTNWKTFVVAGGALNIAADPTNPANKVLDFLEDGNSGGGYGILSGGAIIANGETKTLFFRCRFTTGQPNEIFGLTDVDTPAANSWGSIGNSVRIIDSTVQTCLTGAPTWDTAKPMTIDTWYNVWVVTIHNTLPGAVNTYKLYMNSTPGANGNVTTDHVGTITPSPFRTSGSNANALDRIELISFARSPAAHVLYDDINVMAGDTLINPTLPLTAHNPTPTDGATNVLTTTATLSWSTGVDPMNSANPNPAITKHYVYMKEGDPNLAGQLKQTVGSGYPTVNATASCAMPLALVRDKTYYWRVDESVNNSSTTDPNTIRGPVWSFASEKSIPVITTQPANVRVFAPATASFTAVFTSVSTPTVVWQKNGVFYSAGTLTGTNPYTATLTFATTADSDQAEYRCLLTNLSGQPAVQSNVVALVTKKLLAQYGFENDLNDSSAYGPHNGTILQVDPNFAPVLAYETGLVGTKAVRFNGTAVVDLSTSAYPKTGLGNGMDQATISCWVKATQIGGLITNYNDNILENLSLIPPQPAANTTGFGMALAGTSDGRVHLRGENPGPPISESFMGQAQGAPVTTPPFNMIGDGLWHHIAVAWAAGYQMVVYVDGVQVASTAAGMPASYAAWQRGVVLGGIRTIADRSKVGELYTGLMDDLQIYNYMKTAHEIADIYTAVTLKGVCTETYASTYDYDKNCVIDLADFAVFAANWLDCGFYPLSTCP
jgi:hypothetical protein